jgi:hypothetical protein
LAYFRIRLWAKAPAHYLEAPAGLKITSPKDFQEMRSGFSRADPAKTKAICQFYAQSDRII